MITDIMKIDVKFLLDFVEIFALFVLMAIIYNAFTFDFSKVPNMPEITLNLIKMLGYGFLACYIYYKVSKNDLIEIDVLTYFTFLLASFEALHCFNNSVGHMISTGLRIIIDKFKSPYK